MVVGGAVTTTLLNVGPSFVIDPERNLRGGSDNLDPRHLASFSLGQTGGLRSRHCHELMARTTAPARRQPSGELAIVWMARLAIACAERPRSLFSYARTRALPQMPRTSRSSGSAPSSNLASGVSRTRQMARASDSVMSRWPASSADIAG
jgi:hypothetical protein